MSIHSDCEKNAIVHQLLAVKAQVTVTPLVKHGKPMIYCLDPKDYHCYSKKKKASHAAGKCTFTVTQVICVEIPLTFGAEVDIDEGTIHCCTPEVGPCCVCLAEPRLSELELSEPAEPSPDEENIE